MMPGSGCWAFLASIFEDAGGQGSEYRVPGKSGKWREKAKKLSVFFLYPQHSTLYFSTSPCPLSSEPLLLDQPQHQHIVPRHFHIQGLAGSEGSDLLAPDIAQQVGVGA